MYSSWRRLAQARSEVALEGRVSPYEEQRGSSSPSTASSPAPLAVGEFDPAPNQGAEVHPWNQQKAMCLTLVRDIPEGLAPGVLQS